MWHYRFDIVIRNAGKNGWIAPFKKNAQIMKKLDLSEISLCP